MHVTILEVNMYAHKTVNECDTGFKIYKKVRVIELSMFVYIFFLFKKIIILKSFAKQNFVADE